MHARANYVSMCMGELEGIAVGHTSDMLTATEGVWAPLLV